MDRRRLSNVFLVLAVVLFLADVVTPGTSFPGLGVAGEVLYLLLFGLSLVLIMLSVAYRGRSF